MHFAKHSNLLKKELIRSLLHANHNSWQIWGRERFEPYPARCPVINNMTCACVDITIRFPPCVEFGNASPTGSQYFQVPGNTAFSNASGGGQATALDNSSEYIHKKNKCKRKTFFHHSQLCIKTL
jgi:hypothetical protein